MRLFIKVLVALVILWPPFANNSYTAYADIKKTDLICGQSVESRNLAISQAPDISASKSIVVSKDGITYFERNASERAKIASITKIMTAIIVLENLDPDTNVVVYEKAAQIGESSATLKRGDVIKRDVALEAMLIPSGNDAAIALAQTTGKMLLDKGNKYYKDDEKTEITDPEEVFVIEMNKKAKDIGCSDTLFTNPHGLDENEFDSDAHSTALDVSKFVSYAMQNDIFRNIVSSSDKSISVSRDGEDVSIKLDSTDELLNQYDYAIGVKTGYTEQAGYCFAGAANYDGVEAYSIVLDSPSSYDRFNDAKTLFEWLYSHRVQYKLINPATSETISVAQTDGQTNTYKILAKASHNGWVDKTFSVSFEDQNESVVIFNLNGNVSQEFVFNDITDDVKIGDVVGKVNFYQHNDIIATVNLIAVEDCRAPNFIESIGVWWDRIWRCLKGEQTHAYSEILNLTPLINDKTAPSI